MKLIIDIDKDDYEYMKNGYVPSTFKTFSVIKNGTPIPDNATNGDVIKAMFPSYDFEIYEHKGYIMAFYEDFYTTYPWRWWNAPYQKVR